MSTPAQDLQATPFGQELSANEANDLAAAAKVTKIARGSYLFRTNDPSNALFVILTGSFEVVLGQPGRGETVVATLGPGQIVGELEVMTKSLRVASLIATEDATALELASDKFDSMCNEGKPAAVKVLRNISKALARRLASVNQRIMSKSPPPPPGAPKAEAAAAAKSAEVVQVGDDDLQVLDKLWS